MIFIIFKHKKHKNNNNRCSLKTSVTDNTAALHLSELHSSTSGKVLNGHLYSGVAVEDLDCDREILHGKFVSVDEPFLFNPLLTGKYHRAS